MGKLRRIARPTAGALLLLGALIGCRDAPNKEQPQPKVAAPGRYAPSQKEQGSFAPLVESVMDAVVYVETRRTHDGRTSDELLDRFHGSPGPRDEPMLRGAGSGFIVAADGKVLTNHHVVAGSKDIRVKLEGSRVFAAHVLGSDPLTDLALLELEGDVKDLPVLALGDSDDIRVGDWVVAIGNPFGLASSVSAGIVSAKERDIHLGPYDAFLQTDAAVNPGNSGGPLFNAAGEVIGINSVMVGGGAGIGFAVPSNIAAELLPQLERGEVQRGWFGVSIHDLTPPLAKALRVPRSQGAIVSEVPPETPARRAGLKQDDVVVSIDGIDVESARALSRAVAAKAPGSTVRLGVFRKGKPRELDVVLGRRPDLEQEAPASPAEEPAARSGIAALGLSFESAENGALITSVQPTTAADAAGLVAGSVVIEANGEPVKSAADLARLLATAEPGDVVLLRVEIEGHPLLRALELPAPGAAG